MTRSFRRAVMALVPATLLCSPLTFAQPVGGGTPPKPTNQPPATGAPGATPPATQPPAATQGSAQTPPAKDEGKDPTVDAAAALFKEGKEEEAYKKLQEAVSKNQNLPPARLMLHRMYLQIGKFPQARQSIERAAVETPDHPDIYITLGGYALNDQRLTDAVLQYQQALEVIKDPKRWNESQQKNVRLAALSGLARASEARGQWEQAKKHLDDILKLDFTKGQLAGFRAQLGRIYFMMDNRDQALKELEQAYGDEPAMEPPGVTMGRLFTGKANGERDFTKQKPLFDKAKEWYEYAIKKDVKSFKAHMAFAIWLFDMSYLDKSYLGLAEDELKEAARLDPKAVDVRVLRGLMHRWVGNHPGAETEFESLHKEFPNDFNYLNQYVLAMLEQKDQGKQQRALDMILEFNRRNAGRVPEAAATLGWALFKNNRLDDAENALRSSFQGGQTNSDTIYYYSQILRYRGQLDKAVELLKAATQSPGRFMYRKEAEKDLAQLMPKSTPSGQ
jgi:tetratricopeptide (TPR) repeat protein